MLASDAPYLFRKINYPVIGHVFYQREIKMYRIQTSWKLVTKYLLIIGAASMMTSCLVFLIAPHSIALFLIIDYPSIFLLSIVAAHLEKNALLCKFQVSGNCEISSNVSSSLSVHYPPGDYYGDQKSPPFWKLLIKHLCFVCIASNHAMHLTFTIPTRSFVLLLILSCANIGIFVFLASYSESRNIQLK